MTTEQSIEHEVNILKNDEEKLYSYLSKLAYSQRSKDLQFIESLYKRFIYDNRYSIKSIAIYQLLMSIHSRDLEIRNVALSEIENIETEVESKLQYVVGLCDAYKSTFDEQLISVMYQLYKNTEEVEELRAHSFTGLMKLMGLSTLDTIKKNDNTFIMNFEDIYANLFSRELNTAKEIANRYHPATRSV